MIEITYMKSSRRKYILLFLYFVIYLFLAFNFLKNYVYQLNSDGISYITIAQKYIRGDFKEAINGHWAPLFSWILAPFLSINADALKITKIVSILIGMLAVFAVLQLSKKLDIKEPTQFFIVLSSIPALAWLAVGIITPDLLITGLLIYYFSLIFDKRYKKDRKYGLYIGIIAGLCFLAKQFAGPFFVFHFFVLNLGYYLTSQSLVEKKVILKNFLVALSLFILIIISWTTVISIKYKKLTFSNPGPLNHAWIGPNSPGFVLFIHGLLDIPNKSAVSAWEDPVNLQYQDWSPFASKSNFDYQMSLIIKNFVLAIDIIKRFSMFLLLILLSIIIDFLLNFKLSIKKIFNRGFYFSITIFPYILAYSTVFIEIRYIWPIFIFLIVLAGYYFEKIAELFKIGILKKLLFLLIFIYLIGFPIYNNMTNNLFPEGDAIYFQGIYNKAQILLSYNVKNSKIASNTLWEETDQSSFLLSDKYYGVTINSSQESIEKDLKKFNIDYYIVWGVQSPVYDFLKQYKEVTGGKIEGLRIYSLKEPIGR